MKTSEFPNVDDALIAEMTAENRRRNAAIAEADRYDPLLGIGCCGDRVAIPGSDIRVPATMLADPEFRPDLSPIEFDRIRCRHDFEFWAARCAVIKDKTTGRDINFRLNRPQRRVLAEIERIRLSGAPIRIIMLKARQWGGSTLIQLIMAWIQLTMRRNWNSLICAHVKDTSATIRGMYSKMLQNYPDELWPGNPANKEFRPFERSSNIRTIEDRGCKVTIGSSENQDAIRGGDFAMAHLSEVAFWKNSPRNTPEQFVRAIYGAINTDPLTLIALESTANGVGDFFHREWLRATSPDDPSDKLPVFVPWHEIEIYRRPVKNPAEVISAMRDYEWRLWNSERLTLEQIAWFIAKRREYPSLVQLLAEYPTTAEEAFLTSARNVFAMEWLDALRTDCREPIAVGDLAAHALVGKQALSGIRFVDASNGGLKVWRWPDAIFSANRYVVSVDIGGRAESSDRSVIVVIDRKGGADGATPEIVAEWCGHCDHDILAWRAARIATFYAEAILVFESNTLEHEADSDDPHDYILEQIARSYINIYRRLSADDSSERYGFHTNRSTKSRVINGLIALARDHAFIERSHEAINEMVNYEMTPSGGFAARAGCHDDRLMARAIGFQVAAVAVGNTLRDIDRPYFHRPAERLNPFGVDPYGTNRRS